LFKLLKEFFKYPNDLEKITESYEMSPVSSIDSKSMDNTLKIQNGKREESHWKNQYVIFFKTEFEKFDFGKWEG